MGKAQKLKQKRKLEAKQKELAKIKKRKQITKIVLLVVFFGLAGAGIGYTYLTVKNKASGLVESSTKSFKTGERQYSKVPDMQIDTNKNYITTITTNYGVIKIKLFTKDAPKTVNNFIVLVRDKFYDGLTFHRVIKDFMIQGGDPKGDGTSGPGYQFEDEINSHKLVKGALAMANSGPNTNGSQFFIITTKETPWLDGKHTVFGEVTEGLGVAEEISNLKTGANDKPEKPVVINKIEISEE